MPTAWQCSPQTVTAAEAIADARPLAAQPVRKDKVWLLLAGGAAALFGATIALENNEQLFPAISRANRAMARSREQQQVRSMSFDDRSLLVSYCQLTRAVVASCRSANSSGGKW